MFSNMNSITFSFQLHGNSWQRTSYCRDICYTIHLSPCILLSQLTDFEWISYPSSKLLEMIYIDRQNRLHSSRHSILHKLKIQQPFSANFVRKELLLKTNEVLFAKNIQFLIRYLQICDSLLNHFPQQFLFKKARKWVSFMYNTSVVEVHQYLWVSWIDINRAVCFRRKELQSTSIIIHRKENTFRSCTLYQLVRYTFKIGPSIHVLLNVILIMRIKPDFRMINITFFKLRKWSHT